jgi:hypothetical protein
MDMKDLLTLREEHGVRVSDTDILKKTFVPKNET